MSRRRDVPTGVIGMVHLPPLPGAPLHHGDLAAVLERAVSDARTLEDGGVDAILVENYGDTPFEADRVHPVTIAAATRAVSAVRETVHLPVGVNILRNDARAALSVAHATGASFIRVNIHVGGMYTDQGWVEGRAAETLRLRSSLDADIAILADVHVKHATPPADLSLEDAARDAWERGLADGLILSGAATGEGTDLDQIRRVRQAVPDARVYVGSGVTADTVARSLELAHGVIVGSALEENGRAGLPVDAERVRRLVRAAS